MSNFEFLVSLAILKKYAVTLAQIAAELQRPSMDLSECCFRVGRLRADLADDLANDGSFYEAFVEAQGKVF